MSATPQIRACGRCVKRSWLLGRLAGHLDSERARLEGALALSDRELILALAGNQRNQMLDEYRRVESSVLRARARQSGLELICACQSDYPERLRGFPSAPAALYVAGGLERFLELVSADPVAIVGARRASGYGLQTSRSLGRGLGRAAVTVLSGMAIGVDAAAHAGALEAGGATIAVLPAGADRPYPPAKRDLCRRIVAEGAVVSELPPGTAVRRWTFPARNRIIAALAAATIVVEAGERSGALVTAARALELGRALGAVPGRITSPLAAGSNDLIARGARMVRGTQDVLDLLFGEGTITAAMEHRDPLNPELHRLLRAIGEGEDTVAALTRAGLTPEEGLAALGALELAGYVRREAGGRYGLVP